ncbi:MAG: Uma2 family endonuclease [Gomphosphaeria aponina SAG 52.96 = DSM 107014]|uniref:Uma2 family endonuclease n=1 Tax=Gomphosphaeria aponina SAG 52.96 = DSM 107014 TaxID=1521640 RepID=A0A941GWZ4_9CHRO|nr:Uma2 family endonuclease [Gomphosphaeria aponina SAG 52.96 = DSM 107014]
MQTQLQYLTPDEYLKLELERDFRHEYIAGQVYAMSGTSEEHNIIAGNIYMKLRNHLQGKGCKVFMSDMKARIESLDIFYYPDILVTCNPEDRGKYFKNKPCLIVEVISPSTARTDRNEKLYNYGEIESLQEYVLVSQDQMRVEIYRKNNQGDWLREIINNEGVINIESVGLEITMAEIYEDINGS